MDKGQSAAEWMRTAERAPCEKDGDVQKCVLAWHLYQGVMVTGWRNVKEHPAMFTHWARVPEEPEEAKRLLSMKDREMAEKYGFGIFSKEERFIFEQGSTES